MPKRLNAPTATEAVEAPNPRAGALRQAFTVNDQASEPVLRPAAKRRTEHNGAPVELATSAASAIPAGGAIDQEKE